MLDLFENGGEAMPAESKTRGTRASLWGWAAQFAIVLVALTACAVAAERASITVDATKAGPRISPLLYGIFFEEINHAGEGGLYAELVLNRSFENGRTPDRKGGEGKVLEGWNVVSKGGARGKIALDDAQPMSEKNTHSVRVTVDSAGAGGQFGVANRGFNALPFLRGRQYICTVYARRGDDFSGDLEVSLDAESGKSVAAERISGLETKWRRYEFTLKPSGNATSGRLTVTAGSAGTFWLDYVSLMPADAKGGLRPDILAMLADLKPAFVRFPGGGYVNGGNPESSWLWKEGMGPVEARRTHWDVWGYYTTNGLGLHEYLMMCERLGAEPLPVINIGHFVGGVVPMDKVGSLVQDALDLIEYANGGVTTTWGAKRAANGHPSPFHVKMVEISNESWIPEYEERYKVFYDAIKKKYPNITIISNKPVISRPTEVVDEHYYDIPETMIPRANRYDSYDRKGYKVFVGEYGSCPEIGHGNLQGALAEAFFMMGMERNSDVVTMSSYAPLFENELYEPASGYNNLIHFGPQSVYGTPEYYAEKLFAHNRGDVVLSTDVVGPSSPPIDAGGIGIGTNQTQAEFADIKVSQGGRTVYLSNFAASTKGWKTLTGDWTVASGAYRQTCDSGYCRAMYYAPNWTDYTLSLRARKLKDSGSLRILFRARHLWDDPEDIYDYSHCWEIGADGNSQVRKLMYLHEELLGEKVPVDVQTGKWYDVKIEVSKTRTRCYLDGKLVHDIEQKPLPEVAAIATREDSTGDVLLKVVNNSGFALETSINLHGLGWSAATGQVSVLASDSPRDENSMTRPKWVYPKEERLENIRLPFNHMFPPYSLTIFRLRAAPSPTARRTPSPDSRHRCRS